MDLLKTKEELTAEKATVESKLAALATKEGADKFIKDEKEKIQVSTKPRVANRRDRATMDELLMCEAARLENYPERVIAKAIEALEKQAIELAFDIDAKEITPVKDTEVIK